MDNEIIANIKSLAIDMIDEAKSGHPGIVLGAAPIIYTLYAKHLEVSIKDSKWINRDRFVMSGGHGSALLYATLFMAGYDISIDDIKNFRQVGYKTPGHPEYGITPGVDISTGPLGQGFASAVGMAIASKKLYQELKLPKKNILEKDNSIINHRVYVLCGDGDLMEGITNEAASIAGNLELNNLIVLYDSNNISLDGSTDLTFRENVLSRFSSLGWNTILVKKGNDVKEINKAIEKAKNSNRPTIIEFKTIIGEGSFLAGNNKVHGKPLSKEDIEQLKNNLGLPQGKFYVNEQAKQNFQDQISTRVNSKYMEWSNNYKMYKNGLLNVKEENVNFLFDEIDYPLLTLDDFKFDEELKEATRVTNKTILNKISENIHNFIGGSADVASATNAYLDKFDYIKFSDFSGKNIYFGVREHAMGAILNGMATYNYRVFGSTFLSFSDYMKPSIRMSALMELPVTYIFSHDSILVGEDGPTHQPVEQIATLRATPNLNVFRPCDANELVYCWNEILKSKNTPSVLLLSRTDIEIKKNTVNADVSKGAYILEEEQGKLNGIIIATGTEVSTALLLAHNLKRKYDLNVRVVSMPCMELFEKQPKEYKESVLPVGYKKFVIEAGSKFGWEKYVYNDSYLFTIDNFGVSGPKDQVLEYMKYDYMTMENNIYNLIK